MKTFARNVLAPLMLVGLLLSFAPGDSPVSAQTSCTDIVSQLTRALTRCREINLDYACYGSHVTTTTPTALRFDSPGDRHPIQGLGSINTDPQAGSAFLYLRPADAAQPVTVVLYGGADVSPVAGRSNVFTLRSENSEEICDRTPPAMVVHTDSGERGSITVNGVIIDLESTALLAMQGPDTMIIVNVAGKVAATVPGERQVIPQGWQTEVVGVTTNLPRFSGVPTPSRLAGGPVARFLAGSDGLAVISDPNTESVAGIPPCGGPIVGGQTIVARNATPGQECLYTFCADAGTIVTVSGEAVDTAYNPYLELRAPDHSLLKANDNVSTGNRNSLICNQVLPSGRCGYTIVVRPSHNESLGTFRVRLVNQTACVQPPERCEVVALAGTALYAGPGTSTRLLQTLPNGTEMEAQDRTTTAGRSWIEVQVIDTGTQGWVTGDWDEVHCEITREVVVESAPEPPPPDRPDERPPKESPWGSP